MMSISVGDPVALGHAAAARRRTCRPRGPRRDRSGRRSAWRAPTVPRCRRCRRPSNRRSRTRSAWARRAAARQQRLEMVEVVVAEHRAAARQRMPAIIEAWLSASEKMIRPGRTLRQRRQRRLVGDIAGGEQQRRLLAVQVGQLGFQLDVIVGGAGDVARAARARARRRRAPPAWPRAPPGSGPGRGSRWSTRPRPPARDLPATCRRRAGSRRERRFRSANTR